MTLVAGAWVAHYDLIDGAGKITTASRRLVATTAAEAATAAAAHLVLLLATTDCKCIAYTVGQKYEENALGALPSNTTFISVQAVISASIQDQPNKFASLQIPGPKLTDFAGTSGKLLNIVDVTNINITNYLDDFTAAGNVFLSDGEHLDPVYNASGERVTKYRRLGKQ